MKVMGLALAMLAAAGCTLVELVASPSPTAPIKPTPAPIVLQTLPGPPASPCPEAGIEGTLVEHPATGLGLLDESGAVRTPVIWPAGYRANPSIGGSILFDASGESVAYTGERIRIQATPSDEGGPLVVCGTVVRLAFE